MYISSLYKTVEIAFLANKTVLVEMCKDSRSLGCRSWQHNEEFLFISPSSSWINFVGSSWLVLHVIRIFFSILLFSFFDTIFSFRWKSSSHPRTKSVSSVPGGLVLCSARGSSRCWSLSWRLTTGLKSSCTEQRWKYRSLISRIVESLLLFALHKRDQDSQVLFLCWRSWSSFLFFLFPLPAFST